MITAVVRFRLPEGTTREDAKAMFEKSAPNYRGVPGLVRKYYLYGDDRILGSKSQRRVKRCQPNHFTTRPRHHRALQSHGRSYGRLWL
jgi:hypothetical protein